MKKIGNILNTIIILIMIITQSGIANAISSIPSASGDDPGVTIKATDPILSLGQVELDVTLSSSAGKLNKDGTINITIPKSIVQDPSQLSSQIVIGSPFYLDTPAYIDDGVGNYILNVKYDHTKVNQNSAVGYTFKVIFRAPYFSDHSATPENVQFSTQLKVGDTVMSHDKTTSRTQNANTGEPAFLKYSGLPTKNINGNKTYLLDTDQGTANNTFVVIVNYNHQNYDNVTVTDQLPKDTTLSDSYKILTDITTGDASAYKHLNIYKVDQWNSDGTPKHYNYVTSKYTNDINTTTNSLSVHLGKVLSNDAYVITYGLNVNSGITSEIFGTRYNDAQEFNNGARINQSKVPLIIDSNEYQAIRLNKSVDHKTIASKSGEITYSLDLSSDSDKVSKGTIITDPLPEHTTFDKTINYDKKYISTVRYDNVKNTISYTLLKDLEVGNSTLIKFKVHYNNQNAVPGDTIINKAYLNYAGSLIYSNDATTTLDGSAYLYKVDRSTKNPLEGAIFKIINKNGKTVINNLVSDKTGFINSGLLEPGDYSFIEVQAPIGYQLDSKPIPFTVFEGQETPVNLTATNKKILGSVILTKRDNQDGATLSGAIFKLQNSEGQTIKRDLTTDNTGQIIVKDLAPGNYTFVETKAPTGYQLDSTPVKFSITKGQTNAIKVHKYNQQINHEVRLEKRDQQTNQLLSGAIFKLVDQKGTVIRQNLKTDTNGVLLLKDLVTGKYQLIETKAPTGYRLDQKPVNFTVDQKQTSMTLVKYNQANQSPKKPNTPSHKANKSGFSFKLPQTGVTASKWAISLGIVFIILAGIIIWQKNRKK